MKLAADFRREARDALRGKWETSIWVCFVAGLLGATTFGGGGANFSSLSNIQPEELQKFFRSDAWYQMRSGVYTLVSALSLWTLVCFVIGGAVTLGYVRFNLKLLDREDADIHDLFSQFDRLGSGFAMQLLRALYTFLWLLLLIVPGIIKAYSYAMTPYILHDHPELSANEAITESRRMMDGNKWRLFCLGFSFIGWGLLCSLPVLVGGTVLARRWYFGFRTAGSQFLPLALVTLLLLAVLGAGYYVLGAYRKAAVAAFYRDLSRPEAPPEQPDPWSDTGF